MKHGTRYGYRVAGCRCDECRNWNRVYNASRRQLRRDRAEQADVDES